MNQIPKLSQIANTTLTLENLQNFVTQQFFRGEHRARLVAEIAAIQLERSVLGVNISASAYPLKQLLLKNLDFALEELYLANNNVAEFCILNGLDIDTLFETIDVASSTFMSFAVATIPFAESAEDFYQKYMFLLRRSGNYIAAHTVESFTPTNLFSNILLDEPLRDRIHKAIRPLITDSEYFIDCLIDTIEISAPVFLEKDGLRNFANYVRNLDGEQKQTFIDMYFEVAVYGKSPLEDDLPPKQPQQDSTKKMFKEIEKYIYSFTYHLPDLGTLMRMYRPELVAAANASAFSRFNPKFLALTEDGMPYLDIDKFKSVTRHHRQTRQTIAEYEEQLRKFDRTRRTACSGQNVRSLEKDKDLHIYPNLIELTAHCVAGLVAQRWNEITQLGYY